MTTSYIAPTEPIPITEAAFDLPHDEYRERNGYSKSELDGFIKKCPAFYYRSKDVVEAEEETDAMLFGRLLHALVFNQPTLFYVRPDGLSFTTKEGRAWRDDHADRPIIKQSTHRELLHTADAVRSHPHVKPLMREGVAEISLFGVHRETGLPIKGRPDWLPNERNFVLDLKRTNDASDAALSRTIHKFGYHRQAWMYLDLVRQVFGTHPTDFYIVAVEAGPVPLVNVKLLTQAAVERGGFEIKRALEEVKRCRQSGVWPDYSGPQPQPGLIDLPQWAYSDATGLELIGGIEAETDDTETADDIIP